MRPRLIIVLWLVALLLALAPATGSTISLPHPQAPRRLTIQAFITGNVARDRRVRFHLVGTDPVGWHHLQTLRIAMMLHGQPIQEIAFTLDDTSIATAGHAPVPIGTLVRLPGSFLDVHPGRSFMIRSVYSIRVVMWVKVSSDVPRDAEFRITATDDEGRVSLVRRPARLAAGLLSWGTLALAVGFALFAGAFVGNTFSSRRYRTRQPSIWDILQQRLREERVRRPMPVMTTDDRGMR
jgi:tetrahydromethanopterin S-methyltransferase subunit F